MERVNKILNNSIYKNSYRLNEECEKTRIYCKHDMAHYLNVARIAWIFNLEENIGLSREIVYATALLHDIGKHEQYLNKIPHEIASAKIALDILKDCGFDEEETKIIISAIEKHRDPSIKDCPDLNGIMFRADKMSRSCFTCEASDTCNWDLEKRNLEIKY